MIDQQQCQLEPIDDVVDDGRKRTVIWTIDHRFSNAEASAIYEQWERCYSGWSEPPKLVILEGGSITVLEDDDEGRGG